MNTKMENKLSWAIETEIVNTSDDLKLIKNAGFSAVILSFVLGFLGYYISKNSILAFASFSFLLFIFLFMILNILAKFKADEREPSGVKTDNKLLSVKNKLMVYAYNITNQFITPLYEAAAIILLLTFFIHVIGLSYSNVGLHLATIFNLSASGLVNFLYFIAIILSAISILFSFFRSRNKIIVFVLYLLSCAFIEVTAFVWVGYRLLNNYQFWLSYQLWLAVLILGLAYFALVQYIYANNARVKLAKYKSELSITKAKLDYLLVTGNKNPTLYEAIKEEFLKEKKPKLVISPSSILFLTVYVTLDMKEETEIYFNRGE
ncbi:MAG: hypothetical protein QXL94_02770 [Candidatus Parvarchaeum sp.]